MNKYKWLRFIIGFILVILFFTPYFILGEDAHLRIHDNLDSNVVWIKLLMDNNMLFAAPNSNLDSVMGGLPLSSVYSGYSLVFLFFKLLGVYYGYVTSKLIAALIGFLGMFLLQEEFREKFNLNQYVIIVVSTIFALLPHWGFEASVTGAPIIFYTLFQFYKNKARWFHWLVLIIMPFMSSFILTGLFILLIVGIHYLFSLIQTRKINWSYGVAIIVLTIGYIFSLIPLFYTYFLDENIITHRSEFKMAITSTFTSVYKMYGLLIGGQTHSLSLHLFLLPLIFVYLVIAFFKKEKPKSFKYILTILLFIFTVSFFYGFKNHFLLNNLSQKMTSIVPIQLDRFYMLFPFLWYFTISLVASYLLQLHKKVITFLLIIIFSLQCYVVLKNHELISNRNNLSFKQFYAEDSFNEFKKVIPENLEDFNTLSIGLHPAIAEYNKFSTFDGYFTTYPLKHKQNFRFIIYKELEKDSELKDYFENWGSRCYAFSSEIGKSIDVKKSPKIIHDLDFNFDQIKLNNIKYIFTSSEVKSSELSLFHKSIKNGYPIYLYKVSMK